MMFETQISTALYVAAWNRQDHDMCIRIINGEIALGVRKPAPRPIDWRSDDQRDLEEEAEACGVSAAELLQGTP